MARFPKFSAMILAAAIVAFGASQTNAATFTWTGNSSATDPNGAKMWTDPDNWDCSDSNRTKYPYPKAYGDTAILPGLASKQLISFPVGGSTYDNFGILQVSDPMADYEFINSSGITNGTQIMRFPANDALQISAGKATFNGIGINANGKSLATLTGGTLILKNGASIGKLSSVTIVGTDILLQNGSLLNVGGLTGAVALNISPDANGNGGTLIVDDSILVAGAPDIGKTAAGAKIVFKGVKPRLYVSSGGYVRSTIGGSLEFEIPENGYGWVPIITTANNSKNITNGGTCPTIRILSDSPILSVPYDGTIPLISMKASASATETRIVPNLAACECPPARCAWCFSTAAMPANADYFDNGTLENYSWSETCDEKNATTFIGVAVHGVSGGPVPPTLGPTIAATPGANGKSFSATVTVERLGSGDTPEVFLQYRGAGATAWTEAGTNGLLEVGNTTFDVMLPAVVANETVYELQAFSRVTAGGTNYVSATPATGSVTVVPPGAFIAFSADGSAGDAITVNGTVGTEASIVVEVSAAADFATIHDAFTVGSVAAEGDFAHTFHETDTAASGYIRPGSTYYVRAVATVEGRESVSDVVAVTTPAASTATVSSFTHVGTTVTITGSLDPKGAGATEVHILWCSDAQSFDNDVTVATIAPGDDPDWTWTTTLASAETLFCYKIYAKNACATEQWQTEPVLGKGSELPTDQSALFKWVADETGELSGDWTDRNHWKPYWADGTEYTGVRLDYPDQDPDADPKPFDFSALEGTNAVITLPEDEVRWGVVTNFPGADHAEIVFAGTPGKTTVARSNPTEDFTFAQEGSTLVFEGFRFDVSANVIITRPDSSLVLRDQAYLRVTGKVNIGSESAGGTSYEGNVLLVVDNATLDMSGGSKNRCIWGSVKMSDPDDKTATVVVRGKNPKLLLSGLADCGGDGKILFNIPEGGYDETPIVFAGTDSAQRLPYRDEANRQGKALRFVVDRESDAIRAVRAKDVDCTLVDWKDQGIDTELALLDSDGAKVRVAPGTTLRCSFDSTLFPRTISVRIWNPWPGFLMGLHGVGRKPGPDPDPEEEDDDPEDLPAITGNENVSLAWSMAPASNRIETCVILATENDATATDWQTRLNAMGITTARIRGLLRQADPAACGQRAVRLARADAEARHIRRLGILGDTSGSRLALLLATSSQTPAYTPADDTDDLACHVDFALVDSPEDFVQGGSASVTLVSGDQEEPNASLIPDFRFDTKTCPVWIAQSTTAGTGRYWTANLLYRKMKIFLGKDSEIHLYGPHETGFRFDRATEFMKQIGVLGAKGNAVSLMNVHTGDADRGSYEKEYIWPEGKIPGADGSTFESVEEANRPYIEWHLPKTKTTDSILIVYSGGSYSSSQPDSKEVAPVRRRLNALGMTVVTLHYRALGHNADGHVRAWQDVQRAIRLVRSKAASKGLDPDKIGIMGSSSGGHMTLAVATGSKTDRYAAIDGVDAISAAPQWAVAVYPAYVISGSCNTSRIAPVTTDFQFDEQTPPILFMHGDADTWPSMGSVKTWEKLQRNGVEAELHIFAQNGHTFMTSVYPGTGAYHYIDRIWDFLTAHGFNR